MKNDIKSRDDIKLLVNTFYTKVKQDTEIGFFFEDIARVNWELHLPKMYDFWEAILFGQKGFKGNPMEVHFRLNKLHPMESVHFNRWKSLFIHTVDELFSGPTALIAKQRAESIADLMLFKMGNGAIKRPGSSPA